MSQTNSSFIKAFVQESWSTFLVVNHTLIFNFFVPVLKCVKQEELQYQFIIDYALSNMDISIP